MDKEAKSQHTEDDIDPSDKAGQAWRILALFFVILGAALSIYSLLHFQAVKTAGFSDFSCNINQTFNCDDVAKSPYAQIFGFPLGVYGMGYFLALAFLLLVPMVKEEGKALQESNQAAFVLALIGVATSLIFGGISLFIINALCLTCIGIYLVTFALGTIALLHRKELARGFSWGPAGNGLTNGAIAVAITLVAYNFLKPTIIPKPTTAPEQKEMMQTSLSPTVNMIDINKSPYSGFGEDYRYGPDDAKVVLVEFADFQCPACGQMAITIKRLKQEYGDRVLFVYKNYPLDQNCNPNINRKMHEYSCTIAVMARCAGSFGKFWPYYDLAFARQNEASEEKAKMWGREVGLSENDMTNCLNSADKYSKLQDDIKAGDKVGVQGTPALFLNGRSVINAHDYETLKIEIEKLLLE